MAAADGAIRGGAWPINLKPGLHPDARPKPDFGEVAAPGADVTYVAVDGGVANNEPFELARYTLRRGCEGHEALPPGDKFLQSNPRDPETADRAVLMIDPFPEGPVYTPLTTEEARRLAGIVPAVRRLIPALINQARFKPGELIEATDARVFSRYLLSPSRRDRDEEGNAIEGGRSWRGADAIASGSFGGFGGFFDRSFRAHDYMLGQRNAHSFLKRYFNLRSDNPVLGLPQDRRDAREMVRVIEAGEDFYAAGPPIPRWPRIGKARLDPILAQAEDRVAKLAGKVLKDMGLTWFLRLALGGVWSFDVLGGAGNKVAVALRAKVLHELIRRDQHEGFRERAPGRPFEAWERAVLVRLAEAGRRAGAAEGAGRAGRQGGRPRGAGRGQRRQRGGAARLPRKRRHAGPPLAHAVARGRRHALCSGRAEAGLCLVAQRPRGHRPCRPVLRPIARRVPPARPPLCFENRPPRARPTPSAPARPAPGCPAGAARCRSSGRS